MSLILALIAILVGVIFSLKFQTLIGVWKARKRKLQLAKQFVGPKAYPLIGNTFDLPKCQYEFLDYLKRNAKDTRNKGESLMKFWFFNQLSIFPIDAIAMKDILESQLEIEKGPDYDFYRQWLGMGLLLSSDEPWKQQRRMLTPTFHFQILSNYIQVFNKKTQTFVGKLREYAQNGKEVDIYSDICLCALDIICETTMGIDLNAQINQNQPYVQAVKDFNYYSFKISSTPLYWIPLVWNMIGLGKKTKEAVKTMKDLSNMVIENRTKKLSNSSDSSDQFRTSEYNGKRKALLDMLIEMKKDNHLTSENVREQVDTFMFAGHDTTAHAICWMLWSLACHEEIQAKLHEEISEFYDDADESVEMDEETLKNLRYLDRCVKESLRLFPAVPIIQRTLRNETMIGGKLVPIGTNVAISPFLIHHNEKAYPNPDIFDPDNFLPERVAQRNTYDYIPFSAGPRNCIGQRFALLEIKIMLINVLRAFRLSTDRKFADNRCGMATVLKPKIGVPLRIHPRNTTKKLPD